MSDAILKTTQYFNKIVNSELDLVFGIPFIAFAIKCLLAVYGGALAPKLPVSWAPILSNSYFRIGYMMLIIWVFQHDPTIAILIAIVYFVSMDHLMKHSIQSVAVSGVVTPAVATLLSGGGGPGIKSSDTLVSEAVTFQNQVNVSRAPGQLIVPHTHSLDLTTGTLTTTILPSTTLLSTTSSPTAVPTSTLSSLTSTIGAPVVFTTTGAPVTTTGAPVTTMGVPVTTMGTSVTGASVTTMGTSVTGAPVATTTGAPVATANCGQGNPDAYTPDSITEYAVV